MRDGTTPLLIAAAAEEGNESAVTELLKAGADVDGDTETDGSTPLWLAASNAHEGAWCAS